MKILIVDDNEENLYMLETLLLGNGYEVVSAINGVEALEKLRKDSMDLIISDILMPKMDGFQLCRECKKDFELKNTPFVFYTATYTSKEDEQFALSLGANKFIIKPMDPELFIKEINEVIREAEEEKLHEVGESLLEEEIFLKLYNERLINKLESRIIQLREANRALEHEITERKKAEKQMKKSLQEKVVLLREIHHRVKNNMQVISSLLNLQSAHIKDEDDLKIFKDGQSRVKSMAMIHEKLYQSDDFSKIDFRDYIQSLVSEIFATHIVGSDIKISVDSKDIFFDVDTAIPLGLIMNELLTNSVKHAFPDDKDGEIYVYLKKEDERYLLIVSDNGIGFPKDIDFRKTETLGLQLVNRLVEQLDGTIELDRGHGTEFKIHFKELKYLKR